MTNYDPILNKVGLASHMIWKDPGPSLFDSKYFETYTPHEYKVNHELREMDEVYRFSDIVVVHKATGLRIKFSVNENYFGDQCDYKVLRVFILTNENQRVEVEDFDLIARNFTTINGIVTSDKVRKWVSVND